MTVSNIYFVGKKKKKNQTSVTLSEQEFESLLVGVVTQISKIKSVSFLKQ